MPRLRTYGESCAAAHALELVGDRWNLLVVRELLLGPKRFTDLRAGVPTASANLISQRLRHLEATGVLQRRKLGPPAGTWVYELTDWGLQLQDVLVALGRWGRSSPLRALDGFVGVDAVVLALLSHFDSGATSALRATYQLELGDDTFALSVSAGKLDVVRGSAVTPDAVIATDAKTFLAILTKRTTLADAIAAHRVALTGSRKLVEGLFDAL